MVRPCNWNAAANSAATALSARVVLITGGEGDLGCGLASVFKDRGYCVLAPGRAELDVTSRESVSAFFGSLDQLDVLINNAGIIDDGLFQRQSPGNWDPVIETNLKGSFLCCQAAAAIMLRQRRGHLISIGSYSAIHPPSGQSSYAAAKAGLIALTKSLAKELGKRNICSNCVLPGFLETRMTAPLSDDVKSAVQAKHELGRFTTIEEASEFIAFLAGTSHISGQVFQLDSRLN